MNPAIIPRIAAAVAGRRLTSCTPPAQVQEVETDQVQVIETDRLPQMWKSHGRVGRRRKIPQTPHSGVAGRSALSPE